MVMADVARFNLAAVTLMATVTVPAAIGLAAAASGMTVEQIMHHEANGTHTSIHKRIIQTHHGRGGVVKGAASARAEECTGMCGNLHNVVVHEVTVNGEPASVALQLHVIANAASPLNKDLAFALQAEHRAMKPAPKPKTKKTIQKTQNKKQSKK